jgi:NTE family protein
MIGWRRDKTAFAISGGGARGAVQVGMLRALLEHGIKPDFIVGTSVGAWNGGYLAHEPSVEWIQGLEAIWRKVTPATLQLAWWRAARNLVRRRPSLYAGDGLSRLIAGNIRKHTFEDLAVPFYAVAIDLTAGRKAVFNSGPLAPAVLASSAIPGIFPPVEIDGHQHVDGGGVDPTGLETAIELGARRVYVLNSGYTGQLLSPLRSMNGIVDHAFQVAAQHRVDVTIRDAGRSVDIIHLRPNAGFLRHSMDFSMTSAYLEEGYRFANDVLTRRRSRHVRLLPVSSAATVPAQTA